MIPYCADTVLGTFGKLRKATICFRHVRPTAWKNSDPTGRILMKFDILAFFFFFGKSFEKVQFLLKSGKNNRYFT